MAQLNGAEGPTVAGWRVDEARRALDDLIPRSFVVARYDASYLEDLPSILAEAYGIKKINSAVLRSNPILARVLHLLEIEGITDTLELPGRLREAGIRDEWFEPERASVWTKLRHRYAFMPSFLHNQGRRLQSSGTDLETVKRLQVEYSLHQGGRKEIEFTELARPETGDPWTPLIKRLIDSGTIQLKHPALTIGPRWAGEIRYFRQVIGLENAMGLDLLSRDPELVMEGDMHKMPFDNDHFSLIYQRNTFNKAYDIRQVLRECVRVLQPGGVLISDDLLGYTKGATEVGRTNMQCNGWLLASIRDNVKKVLYDVETPSQTPWFDRVGQIAVQIKK